MIKNLESFTGRFKIHTGQGLLGNIVTGDYLCIGTGEDGAQESDGIRTGVSIVSGESGLRKLPAHGDPPSHAYLVDGCLSGSSYIAVEKEHPILLTYQISMLTMRKSDGALYRAPTLTITLGDPHNAGVWGADDEPDIL